LAKCKHALTKFFLKKIMLITHKHVSADSIEINVKYNRIERTLSYKYLGVIADEKLT